MTLTRSDFDTALQRLAIDSSDDRMDAIIVAARATHVTDEQIARLAELLAHSGETLNFPLFPPTADIASTGGPSSLTTLLCPLFLRCLGAVVPKLGVPGRPAGAIDALAQITGYKIALTTAQVMETIRACGYAHCLASGNHAPLDGALFARRRLVGALAVPALAIASLLSKKLVMNVHNVGIDVRVAPHGNFGANWEAARKNAEQFVRVAKLLGLRATCFLSDASIPCQPYIGRSEALLALDEVFSGTASEWLHQHVARCFIMSAIVTGNRAASCPSGDALRSEFERNLDCQGGSMEAFNRLVQAANSLQRHKLVAVSDGFFSLDLASLRDTIVEANSPFDRVDGHLAHFGDLVGVVLRKRPGDLVLRGEVIADLRSPAETHAQYEDLVCRAIRIMPNGGEPFGFEEV